MKKSTLRRCIRSLELDLEAMTMSRDCLILRAKEGRKSWRETMSRRVALCRDLADLHATHKITLEELEAERAQNKASAAELEGHQDQREEVKGLRAEVKEVVADLMHEGKSHNKTRRLLDELQAKFGALYDRRELVGKALDDVTEEVRGLRAEVDDLAGALRTRRRRHGEEQDAHARTKHAMSDAVKHVGEQLQKARGINEALRTEIAGLRAGVDEGEPADNEWDADECNGCNRRDSVNDRPGGMPTTFCTHHERCDSPDRPHHTGRAVATNLDDSGPGAVLGQVLDQVASAPEPPDRGPLKGAPGADVEPDIMICDGPGLDFVISTEDASMMALGSSGAGAYTGTDGEVDPNIKPPAMGTPRRPDPSPLCIRCRFTGECAAYRDGVLPACLKGECKGFGSKGIHDA